MPKKEPTPTIFRKWRDGTITALFPTLPGIAREPWFCMSYDHFGQHGAARYEYCMDVTTPATPSEFKPLLKELRRIGYSVRIVHRCTSEMTRIRNEAASR